MGPHGTIHHMPSGLSAIPTAIYPNQNAVALASPTTSARTTYHLQTTSTSTFQPTVHPLPPMGPLQPTAYPVVTTVSIVSMATDAALGTYTYMFDADTCWSQHMSGITMLIQRSHLQ